MEAAPGAETRGLGRAGAGRSPPQGCVVVRRAGVKAKQSLVGSWLLTEACSGLSLTPSASAKGECCQPLLWAS